MKGLALLLPVLVALQVGVQPALAWAWPVDGPVLRPFVLGDDPYAGGQHRGIDIAAPAGTSVRAPAAGSVSFAGTVPTGGRTITIRTGDGYAVTLLHLGSYSVVRGAVVGEGDVVGTVGPSGDAAEPQPYLYLGVRVADDPDGYVDPLGLLPRPAPPDDAAQPDPAPDPAPAPAPADGGKAHATPSPHAASDHVRAGVGRRVRVPVRPTAAASVPVDHVAARDGAPRGQSPARPRSAAPTGAPADRPLASPRFASVANREPASGRSFALPPVWQFAGAVAAAGAVMAAFALSARRRRELGDARPANGPASVLLQRAAAPAEDAGGLRLRQEDHVVLDGDLEGILLPEPEALADLDRDDDPAEVVDVSDDPRFRCPFGRANRRDSLACSVRPHSSSAIRLLRTLGTSPRHVVSNPHFGVRGRHASFV